MRFSVVVLGCLLLAACDKEGDRVESLKTGSVAGASKETAQNTKAAEFRRAKELWMKAERDLEIQEAKVDAMPRDAQTAASAELKALRKERSVRTVSLRDFDTGSRSPRARMNYGKWVLQLFRDSSKYSSLASMELPQILDEGSGPEIDPAAEFVRLRDAYMPLLARYAADPNKAEWPQLRQKELYDANMALSTLRYALENDRDREVYKKFEYELAEACTASAQDPTNGEKAQKFKELSSVSLQAILARPAE
ncbi:MAG: hypothetical protein QM755_01525 [Luteolibacter sp.]